VLGPVSNLWPRIKMIWWRTDPLLGKDLETTRQQPLLCNDRKIGCYIRPISGQRPINMSMNRTIEELFWAVFSFGSALRLYNEDPRLN
jgi:hypothetical protein